MSQELTLEQSTEQLTDESPPEGATSEQAESVGQDPVAEPEQPAEG